MLFLCAVVKVRGESPHLRISRNPENDTGSFPSRTLRSCVSLVSRMAHASLSLFRVHRSRSLPFFLRLPSSFVLHSGFGLVDRPGSYSFVSSAVLPRKEVIQPHLPIRLPCYDFTPVIDLALDGWLLSVASPASGTPNSHGVTGGVYKARERIHRGMLIRDY